MRIESEPVSGRDPAWEVESFGSLNSGILGVPLNIQERNVGMEEKKVVCQKDGNSGQARFTGFQVLDSSSSVGENGEPADSPDPAVRKDHEAGQPQFLR